jgi:amylosucrase
MGDELAMENDHAYQDDPRRAHDTRWVQRAPFDAQRFADRHDRASTAGSVYQGLRDLIGRRQRQDALAAGAPRTLLASGHRAVLALARGEHFLNLSNFSAGPVTVSLADLGTGPWPGHGDQVVLEPWAMLWLER